MGKAAGLSGVPIEVIQISGLESVLARIGNSMMYGAQWNDLYSM